MHDYIWVGCSLLDGIMTGFRTLVRAVCKYREVAAGRLAASEASARFALAAAESATRSAQAVAGARGASIHAMMADLESEHLRCCTALIKRGTSASSVCLHLQ